MPNKKHSIYRPVSRREMLGMCKAGFGSVAFASLFSSIPGCSAFDPKQADLLDKLAGGHPLPNFVPKAKNIIFLYMDGGVSQVDSFDPKPRLDKENGEDPGKKFKVDATQFGNVGKILKSPWGFKKYGESGMDFSDLFPHMATCADDMVMIRSMVSNFPEHTSANYFLHTGSGLQGRPSMGAWVNYGLGSENRNLPSFVVLARATPYAGNQVWASDFLPGAHQGTLVMPGAEPIANINRRAATTRLQELELQAMAKRDRRHLLTRSGDPMLTARMKSFETAFGMQMEAPDIFDLSKESDATLAALER